MGKGSGEEKGTCVSRRQGGRGSCLVGRGQGERGTCHACPQVVLNSVTCLSEMRRSAACAACRSVRSLNLELLADEAHAAGLGHDDHGGVVSLGQLRALQARGSKSISKCAADRCIRCSRGVPTRPVNDDWLRVSPGGLTCRSHAVAAAAVGRIAALAGSITISINTVVTSSHFFVCRQLTGSIIWKSKLRSSTDQMVLICRYANDWPCRQQAGAGEGRGTGAEGVAERGWLAAGRAGHNVAGNPSQQQHGATCPDAALPAPPDPCTHAGPLCCLTHAPCTRGGRRQSPGQ